LAISVLLLLQFPENRYRVRADVVEPGLPTQNFSIMNA